MNLIVDFSSSASRIGFLFRSVGLDIHAYIDDWCHDAESGQRVGLPDRPFINEIPRVGAHPELGLAHATEEPE